MTRLPINNSLMLGFGYMEEALDRLSKCSNSYPPYNIEQIGDSKILIKLAVAGFVEEELSVIQDNKQLIISSLKKEEDETEKTYIHKGISFRKFEKVFILSEDVEPSHSYLENGILVVELRRITKEKNIKVISIVKPCLTDNKHHIKQK